MAERRHAVSRPATAGPAPEVTDAGWDPYIVALTHGARSPDPHGGDDRSDWVGDADEANVTRRGQVMAWLRDHRAS